MAKQKIKELIKQNLNNPNIQNELLKLVRTTVQTIPNMTISEVSNKEILNAVGIKIREVNPIKDYELATGYEHGKFYFYNRYGWRDRIVNFLYIDKLSDEEIKKMLIKKYKLVPINKLKAKLL